MDTGVLLVVLSFSLTFFGVGASTCANELNPNRVLVYDALPGDFFGNSTRPTDCTVLPCMVTTPLSDGVVGDTSQMVDSSQFLAWNEDFRIALVVSGSSNTLVDLRTINLHFYHDLSIGAVLPELVLRASNSDSVPGDQPIPYTFTNNTDLTTSDSQIRSVAIVIPNNIDAGNRLHISSSLKSGQQFVLSEVELCIDPADVVAEPLSVDQLSGASELSNESVIKVPANKTIRSGNYTLSCTVVNQGRFQWEWTVPNSVSVTSEILDATRTSVIEVPQSTSSVGEYTCTARYHTDSGLQNADPGSAVFSIEFELILYTSEAVVKREGTLVILKCILAGDESVMVDIQWSFEGRSLTDSSKYSVLSNRNSPCVYGTCHNSQLQIKDANSDDEGTYTCSYRDHTQEIRLIGETSETYLPPTILSPSPSPSSSTKKPATQPPTDNLLPVIIGAAGGGVGAIILVAFFIIVCYCCNRWMRTTKLKRSPMYSSEDESDALYQVIPKKDIPPPLPDRPPPGSGAYATVDAKTNGHLELTNLSSGNALRDSVISMPADINGSDHTLAKLTVNANGQGLNLRNNPLYSSADNLISNAPPVPDKAYTSSPGMFAEESHLNIYAVPNKPPPLPARMLSPELKEGSPDPIYTETGLSPTQFSTPNPVLSHSQFQVTTLSSTGSPEGSTKICPYASIYADPQPLRKEEGPIEVRPYHIKEIRQLGTGQFGEVMLAETQGISENDLKLGDSMDKSTGILVAVKRLKQNAEKVVKEAFEKEIKFMARLNHINVIRMLAICPTGQPFILMEYMEFGDLNQYLQKYKVAASGSEPTEKEITVDSLLYACVQISNGMRYLASLHFIHRDLATRNFLVGKDQNIKIADFGMSRSLYSSHYYRIQGRAILPIRWMANECFYGRFSEMTDVWAFGVAMWEVFMLAKIQPYDELNDQQVIENAVNPEKTKLLQRPQHCPEEVYEVMLQCWEKDPEKRINFEDVYSSLAALHSYSDL